MPKAESLHVRRIDAERAARDLVLAQRLPGAPDRQPPQAQGEQIGDQRQRQDHEIEKDDALRLDRNAMPKNSLEGVAAVRRARGAKRHAEEGRPRNVVDAVRAAGDRATSSTERCG